MRKAYSVICHLIALCVVLQAAWIAAALFTIDKHVEDGHSVTKGYDNWGQALHSVFAVVVLVLGLALLILSYFVKTPGAAKWAGFTFLAIVVQWVLAIVSFAAPVVGVLHGANAFAILALAELTARRMDGAAPLETAPAAAAL
jgi:uncharacterized membrane protein (Fun14 family)